MAVALLAGTLVPALRLMRQSLERSRDVERRNLIVNLAAYKLEEEMAIVSSAWSTGSVSGNFATTGNAELSFSITKSDSSSGGGIPNRLMAIESTVWHDANGNSVRDSGESYVRLASKVSKLAGYPQ